MEDEIKFEDVSMMFTIFSKLFNLVYSMACYGGLFAVAMAVMVYFKQDGMLYHPAVPDERYRYP